MLFLTRLLLCLAVFPALSWTQIALHIGDEAVVTVSAADLAKMPRHTVKMTDHGTEVTFGGVLARDVLSRPGVPLGKELREKRYRATFWRQAATATRWSTRWQSSTRHFRIQTF